MKGLAQKPLGPGPLGKPNNKCLKTYAIPYIVPAQLFAASLAEVKRLDPDKPRSLSKVTQNLDIGLLASAAVVYLNADCRRLADFRLGLTILNVPLPRYSAHKIFSFCLSFDDAECAAFRLSVRRP